jgi:hypothetical protein
MSHLSANVEDVVRDALARSWSEQTSVCFNPAVAPLSYGQCAPTAVVVFEMFGGEILRTEAIRFDGSPIRHFYNRIGGQRYDFTADQFDVPDYIREFTYKDIPSSVEEALTEMLPGQLEAMRVAFKKEMAAAHAG